MAFISDSTLKGRLAGMLKVASSGDLQSYWDNIVTDANVAAYNDIVSALADQGYSAAQIAAWDRGTEFNTMIGLFWALTMGAGLHGYDDKFISKLDRREELQKVAFTIGGVIVDPADLDAEIGHGDLDTTTDLFSMDPDDERRGEVTKW